MLQLRTIMAGLLCFGVWLSEAEAQNHVFQISDVSSRCGVRTSGMPKRNHKIANLAIEYSDGRVTDGFRVLDGNKQKLVRWSEITSLEIGSPVGGGTPNKYVQCSVQFSDNSRQNLSCVDGIVLGKTINGDYKKPLGQVAGLIPGE
jgi:hypothetical protein